MKLETLFETELNKKLFETLFPNDLDGLVLDTISIDEFYPKVDDTAMVLAFFVTDEYPAQDLSRFIEFGPVEVLDVEVSPSPDENGNYLVFVEMDKTTPEQQAEKITNILKNVAYLVNVRKWNYTMRRGKTGIIDLDA